MPVPEVLGFAMYPLMGEDKFRMILTVDYDDSSQELRFRACSADGVHEIEFARELIRSFNAAGKFSHFSLERDNSVQVTHRELLLTDLLVTRELIDKMLRSSLGTLRSSRSLFIWNEPELHKKSRELGEL